MRPSRRLTLLDLMILVGATALGLSLARAVYPGGGIYSFPHWESIFRGPATCVAAALAAALVAYRLRRPRPRWRRIARQPGFVACVASLASLALGFAAGLGFDLLHTPAPGGSRTFHAGSAWACAIAYTPAAVAGAWLALWWAKGWSAERSNIDRLGRLVGLFWVADFVFEAVAPGLHALLPWL